MSDTTALIPAHGGYTKLATYRRGTLIYDATAAFCAQNINSKDRTYDQMVQAACSGVANIVEGSEASATSKKSELKLTNVAKASLEELLADYQTFLRQRDLPLWSADAPKAQRVRDARPADMAALRQLMAGIVSDLSDLSDLSDKTAHSRLLLEVGCNTMITLINQETYLLKRQIARLAKDFENNGGFTERMYRIRTAKRADMAKNTDSSDQSDLSDVSDKKLKPTTI